MKMFVVSMKDDNFTVKKGLHPTYGISGKKTGFKKFWMASIENEGYKQGIYLSKDIQKDLPEFRPGDNVKVYVKIVEGDRERIQIFEGLVIKRRGGGVSETFTVRKNSYGIGVERTFPIHAPSVDKIEVTRRGKVRRAKLNYIRTLSAKAARIKERR